MIRNERQYKISRARTDEIKASIEALRESADGNPMTSIMLAAMSSQLADLEAELHEYETLRDNTVVSFPLTSLSELPNALIRARIAANLTQKELADRLNVKQQQIQRYEDGGYQRASLDRLLTVADALGLQLAETKLLSTKQLSANKLLQHLNILGLSKRFVQLRLAPPEFLGPLSEVGDGSTLKLIGRLNRVFGWTIEELLSNQPLQPIKLEAVAFRLHQNQNHSKLAAHTKYARYIAELAVKALPPSTPSLPIPQTSSEMLELLDHSYQGPNFFSALQCLWDLGVVTVPFDDPGAFQGAAWRIGGRNIIALNTRHPFDARWCHDFLHEAHHLTQSPEQDELEIIEPPHDQLGVVDVEALKASKEERDAEAFARGVELRGQAEKLVKKVTQLSSNQIPRFKYFAAKVATEANVEVGSLANYLAWRLSLQGEDWWGAAQNLQEKGDALAKARSELFNRLDLDLLNEEERQLIIQALRSTGDLNE